MTEVLIREVVLDTETTGLDPKNGHRIIEIGCVELINHLPTGRHFHRYINPQRDVEPEASKVSGLTTEFLKSHPIFVKVVDEFLEFIGDDVLVIHNASFDMGFINAELDRLCRPLIPQSRAIDTLKIARQKFPGSPVSLDALCRRFAVDLSSRTKHGALIDSELLAQVYLELIGDRQKSMTLQSKEEGGFGSITSNDLLNRQRPYRASRNFQVPPQDLVKHQEFISHIKDALWLKS